ncbi:hypothetical protein ACE4Z5_24125, partial [Salmonella enterica]
DRVRLAAEKTVAEEKLAIDREIKSLEIERARALEIAEIERRKSIELADQRAEIDVAQQATARAEAQAQAEAARAAVVRAEEQVISARDIERAEREKTLQLIAAGAESERAGLQRRATAETDGIVAEAEARAL